MKQLIHNKMFKIAPGTDGYSQMSAIVIWMYCKFGSNIPSRENLIGRINLPIRLVSSPHQGHPLSFTVSQAESFLSA